MVCKSVEHDLVFSCDGQKGDSIYFFPQTARLLSYFEDDDNVGTLPVLLDNPSLLVFGNQKCWWLNRR